MILEIASMQVRPGKLPDFERAIDKVLRVMTAVEGYLAHEVCVSLEQEHHVALLVEWRSLPDRTRGFGSSNAFFRCRALLDPCLEAEPHIEHYKTSRTLATGRYAVD